MSMSELLESVKRAHAETYGREAETTAYAPGRVNLLGEHTDYNGGFVLPMPLLTFLIRSVAHLMLVVPGPRH